MICVGLEVELFLLREGVYGREETVCFRCRVCQGFKYQCTYVGLGVEVYFVVFVWLFGFHQGVGVYQAIGVVGCVEGWWWSIYRVGLIEGPPPWIGICLPGSLFVLNS